MRPIVKLRRIALLVMVVLAATLAPTSARAATRPPNILYILTDDLDLASIAYMPKLKALVADQGASFSNYYVSVSLCCPSRSSTLRGQYSHNTGVLTNGGSNGGFEVAYLRGIEKSTVATWLQGAGYKTALFGKYLNGYPSDVGDTYVPPGWNEWDSAVGGNSYSEFDYTLNENGKLVKYGNTPADYGTDVYAKKAADFIQKSAGANQPFFIYMAVYAPHQPATPAPRHADLFADVKAPRNPNYDEADVSDKPEYIQRRPLLTAAQQKNIDELYRRRLQSLQAVDEAIENLYNTLKTSGQLENTYIVFTSDNGFHLGQHRMPSGKQTAYEEDVHLPLIVRGPGIAAGSTIPTYAGNIDLAPTFAEIAGAKADSFVDGRSLVPLFSGNAPASTRQVYLLEHWVQGPGKPGIMQEPDDTDQQTEPDPTATPKPRAATQAAARAKGIPEFHALRFAGYTYVEYETGERELYDNAKDPFQLQNLAATTNPATLQMLSARLAALVTCKAEACRTADGAPLSITTP